MPHISKGGKYVFGWSRIRANGSVVIPNETVQEYRLKTNEKVILISGSKTSGGFVVAKKSLIERSAMAGILTENPKFARFQIEEGKAIKFKGRLYCWARIRAKGVIVLPPSTLETFALKPGDCLLSIRGSNLGFVMGAQGPIIEKARTHPEIQVFE